MSKAKILKMLKDLRLILLLPQAIVHKHATAPRRRNMTKQTSEQSSLRTRESSLINARSYLQNALMVPCLQTVSEDRDEWEGNAATFTIVQVPVVLRMAGIHVMRRKFPPAALG